MQWIITIEKAGVELTDPVPFNSLFTAVEMLKAAVRQALLERSRKRATNEYRQITLTLSRANKQYAETCRIGKVIIPVEGVLIDNDCLL